MFQSLSASSITPFSEATNQRKKRQQFFHIFPPLATMFAEMPRMAYITTFVKALKTIPPVQRDHRIHFYLQEIGWASGRPAGVSPVSCYILSSSKTMAMQHRNVQVSVSLRFTMEWGSIVGTNTRSWGPICFVSAGSSVSGLWDVIERCPVRMYIVW